MFKRQFSVSFEKKIENLTVSFYKQNLSYIPKIAIIGPIGSGKSCLAKKLAQRLKIVNGLFQLV